MQLQLPVLLLLLLDEFLVMDLPGRLLELERELSHRLLLELELLLQLKLLPELFLHQELLLEVILVQSHCQYPIVKQEGRALF